MINVEFLLTKHCDQSCDYCNVFCNSKFKKNPEVDLDFLKYVISCLNFKSKIILGGGEPGTITNIDEVYKLLRDNKNILEIRLLSNGLCRKIGIEWLNEIEYFEHLIKYIDNKKIVKFHDLELIDKSVNKSIIVTSELTIKSLLNNFDYFYFEKLFEEYFLYKLFIEKTKKIDTFKEEIFLFFKKINQEHLLYGFEKDKLKSNLCSKYPYMLSIDFENKNLLHCNSQSIICKHIPFSKQNFYLALKGNIFHYEEYCNSCHVYNNNILGDVFERRKDFEGSLA